MAVDFVYSKTLFIFGLTKQNFMKQLVVNIGKTKTGTVSYISIPDIGINDGRNISADFKKWNFGKALFGVTTCGAIFELEAEGENVRYNKKQIPLGYWKNREDVAIWQLQTRGVALKEKQDKQGKENKYAEILEPIRIAYRTADYQTRALILAEVMRNIAGGALNI